MSYKNLGFGLAIGLVFTAATAGTVAVSSAQMGNKWPFSVNAGVLQCADMSVTFLAAGKTYAVNGTAKGRIKTMGWRDEREIRLDNPEIPGTKVPVGPLIEQGLKLCS